MDVLIISQSDKEVGLGHFKRSQIILKELKDNFKVKALLAIFTDFSHYEFFSDLNIVSLEKNLGNLFTFIKKITPKIVVLELSYNNLFFKIEKLINYLIKLKIKIVAIDGLLELNNLLDLIFLPSFSPSLKEKTVITL